VLKFSKDFFSIPRQFLSLRHIETHTFVSRTTSLQNTSTHVTDMILVIII